MTLLLAKWLATNTRLSDKAIARLAAVLPYVLAALLLWGALAAYGAHREAEGRRKCDDAQEAADARVEREAATVAPDFDRADDTHTQTIQEARDGYADTLTQTDLERARRAGIRLGRTLERQAVLAALAAEGGGLVQPYAPDSRMLARARSLQCDVFGDCAGADGTRPADPLPALAGRPPVPGPAQGGGG